MCALVDSGLSICNLLYKVSPISPIQTPISLNALQAASLVGLPK